MENSLIREIMTLTYDIYSTYKEPKIFKFKPVIKIKKWNVKRKLNKFKKQITKVLDNCKFISYDAVVDYFSYIGLSYPPKGNYKHTDIVKSKDLEYEFASSFSFQLNHKDKNYNCQALIGYEKDNKGINIIFTCKDKNNVILQFTDENITVFEIKEKDLNPEIHTYDLQKEGNIIRNVFARTLLFDIKEFIIEKIEFYKERI